MPQPGEGYGTSLYMEFLQKIYHHSPSFGPLEAKKYEGQNSLPLTFGATYQRAPIGSYASLDTLLKGNYNPITFDEKSSNAKPSYNPGKNYSLPNAMYQ